jgi:hypothetical protein
MAAYVYELNKEVWHGYTRPKGEPISLISSKKTNILDNHGCGTFDVLDSSGDKMNVWECEIVLRGWSNEIGGK